MRYLSLIGLALTLSGCALERSVTFIYYPNQQRKEGDFYGRLAPDIRPSQFDRDAQTECAKYGLAAAYEWANYTTFQRVRVHYRCVPPNP